VLDTAAEADAKRARDLTASLKAEKVVILDSGYLDPGHFAEGSAREIIRVSRWKEGMLADVFETRAVKGKILSDEIIGLSDSQMVRRIGALVVVDGLERKRAALTNQWEWSAEIMVELYEWRREIEWFFKRPRLA